MSFINLPSGGLFWGSPVATSADLPATAPTGQVRVALDTEQAYLFNGATWDAVFGGGGGSGNVVGPASATDNAIVRFDTTTGKLIQNSVVTIADTSGNIAGAGTISSAEITSSSLTASRVLVSGSSKEIQSSSVTTTTLGFLDATSSIQTQLNAKQATGNYITALTSDVTAAGPGSVAATIAVGAVTDTKGSLAVKPSVTVVATTNQTLSGTPTIDGQATAAGSVILLTAQTAGAENGPWVAAAGAWSRPTWYPAGGTTQAFQFITTFVRLGTTYQGTTWRITSSGAVTIDTTSTTWAVAPLALNSSSTVGALPINRGGTNAATFTSGKMTYFDGTSLLSTGAVDYATATQNVLVTSSGAAIIPLVVRAAASQTSRLTQWQDTSSNILASIGPVSAGDQRSQLFLYNTLETTITNYERLGLYADSTNNSFRIDTLNGGTGTRRPLVFQGDSLGKVGVATIAPANTFSVSPVQYSTGTASQSGTTVTGSGTTFTSAMVGAQFVYANGVSSGTITAFGSTTSLTVTTSQTVSSQAYTISYSGLQVTSAGLVGVGTSSPASALQIGGTGVLTVPLGSVGSPSITFPGNTNTGMWSQSTNIITFSSGGGKALQINSTSLTLSNYGADFALVMETAAGANDRTGFNLNIGGQRGTGSGTPGSIVFQTSTALASGGTVQTLSERMRVNGSNGFVGIGTTSPGVALDVVGTMRRLAGTSTAFATIGGTTFQSTTTQGNTTTAETDLFSNTLAANTLVTNGDTVEFYSAGTFAATVNTKRVRVYFGSTTILDTGALAVTAASNWRVTGTVIRTGATTQKAIVTLMSSDSTVTGQVSYTTPAETLSGTVVLRITGTGTATNDIVGEIWKGSWQPAAT